jgi:hypothetical protein
VITTLAAVCGRLTARPTIRTAKTRFMRRTLLLTLGALLCLVVAASPARAQELDYANAASFQNTSTGTGSVTRYNGTTGAVVWGPQSRPRPSSLARSTSTLYVQTGGNGVVALDPATGNAKAGFTTIPHSSGVTDGPIAVLGNTLYVAASPYVAANTIRTYNATTGALINASFITLNDFVTTMTASGNVLYVGNVEYVQAYNATTGARIGNSASFGGNADLMWGMAVSGNTLYCAFSTGKVVTLNATTLATVSTSFITQANTGFYGLAVLDNTLYLLRGTTNGDWIGCDRLLQRDNGAAINANLITSGSAAGKGRWRPRQRHRL